MSEPTTSNDSVTDVRRLLSTWEEAEARGDSETLAGLAVDDFTLVGPYGFLLDRDQWLGRYRSGDLVNSDFRLEDVSVRSYGDMAIAIGTQVQSTTHQGNDVSGAFRITLVATRAGGEWLLAGCHLSLTPPAPGGPPT